MDLQRPTATLQSILLAPAGHNCLIQAVSGSDGVACPTIRSEVSATSLLSVSTQILYTSSVRAIMCKTFHWFDRT